MTMGEERESLGAALREAARSFEAPDGELLYAGALSRGRRLRRRRTAGTAAAGLLACGVAVALGFGLSGVGGSAPRPAPVATAPAVISAKALPKYMAATFWSLLPTGTALQPDTGVYVLTGSGYVMPSNIGDWESSAQAMVTYRGVKYSLVLSVSHERRNTDCETGFALTDCHETPLGKGQYVDLTLGDGTSEPYSYEFHMNYSGGKSVALQVNPNSHTKHPIDPFSTAQLEKILTAPAWDPVLAGLPALVACPNLQPAPGKSANTEWICASTGKLYPSMDDEPYLSMRAPSS
jgi:hypothetical protein